MGAMTHWKAVTAAVIVGAAVALIAYDVVAELEGGNSSTISQVLLNGARSSPIIAFAFGVLMGHLFWAQQP